jgi:hypothetical protein
MVEMTRLFSKLRGVALACVLLVSACNTYEPAILDATYIVEDATQAIERLNRIGALEPYADEIFTATHMAIFPNARRPQVSKFNEGRDGILLARDTDGTWRGPAFYRLHHHDIIHTRFLEHWDEDDRYEYGFPGRTVILLFEAGTEFERLLQTERLTVASTQFGDYTYDSDTDLLTFKFGEDEEVRVIIEAPINEKWQNKNYSLWDRTWMDSQTELDEGFFGERARPRFISRTETGYPSTHQYPAATRRLERALDTAIE